MQSTTYLGQNPSNIPVQVGCAGASSQAVCPSFTQDAAAKYIRRLTVANYFGVCETGTQQEVADGYNYFNGSTAQQLALVQAYVGNNFVVNTCASGQVKLSSVYSSWQAFASNCGGYVGSCKVKSLIGYEGGYSLGAPNGLRNSDQSVAITGSNNSNPCNLTTASGNGVGAVSGALVSLSNITETGGTSWATLAAGGSLTVGNGTSTAIPLSQSGTPVDCSAYDTLNSAMLIDTGSEDYINALRQASYQSPLLYQYTLQNYAYFNQSGGIYPSQFYLAGPLQNGSAWLAWGGHSDGYTTQGTCTACTIPQYYPHVWRHSHWHIGPRPTGMGCRCHGKFGYCQRHSQGGR